MTPASSLLRCVIGGLLVAFTTAIPAQAQFDESYSSSPASVSPTTWSPPPTMDTNPHTLSTKRIASQHRHLVRVAAWGGSNALGGAALWATADANDWRAFGLQSGLWGAINVGIAATGLLGSDDPTDDWQDAVSAERNYSDILLANLGLNVGYMGVGTAMVLASGQGVDRASDWRGHGTALILQGLGLFVLDAISWAASRDRLSTLLNRSSPPATR